MLYCELDAERLCKSVNSSQRTMHTDPSTESSARPPETGTGAAPLDDLDFEGTPLGERQPEACSLEEDCDSCCQ